MFGAIQGIANIFRQKKANQALDQLLSQDVKFNRSPFAAQQLGLAKQLYNGRMAGAPQLERNIFANQATRLGGLQRNATDSSQLLSLGAQSQGMTNDALEDLQIREAQNKYNMLSNLNQAYGTNIQQDEMAYQDDVRRFGNLAEIRGQQQQNKTNALNGVFNGLNSDINQGLQIAGLFGGFPGLGGIGRGQATASGGQETTSAADYMRSKYYKPPMFRSVNIGG